MASVTHVNPLHLHTTNHRGQLKVFRQTDETKQLESFQELLSIFLKNY